MDKLNVKLVKIFQKRIPITEWILRYTKEDFMSDIIAGITISLTIIPQSVAYAALAGLDPQYGLNSAFMGCFIYVFFGTIKEVVIGPSSLMALLTYEYTHDLNVDFVVLLCFLSGIVEFLMGIFQLGFLVSFISAPVISGFTSATSVIIVVSQMKGLLGLRFSSKGFIDNLSQLYENILQTKLGDSILGISCIIALLCLRKLKDLKFCQKRTLLKKIFWFLSISRNALVISACVCISYFYKSNGSNPPFITSKPVNSGIPEWRFPPMATQIGNTTYNFPEMINKLGSGIVVVPVVSIFANVAIGKAFAQGKVDATQEMITLAFCNIFGSFFQSMPTTGAFTRSAVISSSGVRSPLACLYSASLTLLALKFLSPYFQLIPRSSLSAVLIAAVIFLIDYEIVLPLWKTNRFDLITLAVSFVASLCLGVEIGLLVGVAVGFAALIGKWARPNITVEKNKISGGCTVLKPELNLYFPSVDYLSTLIMKNALEESGENTVIIDCSNMTESDYTTAKNFHILSKNFQKRGQPLLFLNAPAGSRKMWITAGCREEQFCTSENLISTIAYVNNTSEPLLKTDIEMSVAGS